jgi:pyruvate,water dikinase
LRSADDLRAVSPRAAELVTEYLAAYGWRPLSADVEAATLAEHPDRLVDLVRSQAAKVRRAASVDPFDELRGRVPAPDLAECDRLVDEARECYASLDDNSGITASAVGALRRVVLEVGRRAHLRTALAAADDVFNLTSAELLILTAGGTPLTADELADRRTLRILAGQQPPPPVIGGDPVPPPDPSVFPGALGEIAAAVGAYLDQKFTTVRDTPPLEATGSLAVDGHAPVRGIPVVAGTVVGRIVVSRDPDDALDRIEPGDILVCPFTTAAHNAIFPMLGGVLTQFGGPLGHTAVMAREFDIPAVVGADSLPLHLDGCHGELTVDRLR